MPNRILIIFKKTIICALFIAFLATSVLAAKRCRGSIDTSLLTLYLNSDAVATAYIRSEEISRSPEEGANFVATIKHKAHIASIFKGTPPSDFSYIKQYQIVDGYSQRNFDNRPKIGDKVLLFLGKAPDKLDFYPSEWDGPSDNYEEKDIEFIEARLRELNGIISSKRDQIPQLTEWLVKLAENESTSIEGIDGLTRSFGAIDNEEKKKPQSKIKMDKDFSLSSVPEVALGLTGYQKQRLSKAFYRSIGEAVTEIGNYAEGRGLSEYRGSADALAGLVSRWDIRGVGDHLTMLLEKHRGSKMNTAYLTSVIADAVFDDQLRAYREEWGRVFPYENKHKDDSFVSEAEVKAFDQELRKILNPNEEISYGAENQDSDFSAPINSIEPGSENTVAEPDKHDGLVEDRKPAAGAITYREYRKMLIDEFLRRLNEMAMKGYESEEYPEETEEEEA